MARRHVTRGARSYRKRISALAHFGGAGAHYLAAARSCVCGLPRSRRAARQRDELSASSQFRLRGLARLYIAFIDQWRWLQSGYEYALGIVDQQRKNLRE